MSTESAWQYPDVATEVTSIWKATLFIHWDSQGCGFLPYVHVLLFNSLLSNALITNLACLNKENQEKSVFGYLILITIDFYDFISLFSP